MKAFPAPDLRREAADDMIMVRDLSNLFQQMSGMPVNSKNGQDIMKKAGIDTNSKQYKAVMQSII